MDAKHTPGPWLAERETAGYANGLSHWQIRALEEPEDGLIVAAVITDIDELRAAGAANARLIAAAPDLLDALSDFVQLAADAKRSPANPNNAFVDLRDLEAFASRARAALTKATGDQSQ